MYTDRPCLCVNGLKSTVLATQRECVLGSLGVWWGFMLRRQRGADWHGDLGSSRYICRKSWEYRETAFKIKKKKAAEPPSEASFYNNGAARRFLDECRLWGLFRWVDRVRYVSIFVIVECRLKGGGEPARLHSISQEKKHMKKKITHIHIFRPKKDEPCLSQHCTWPPLVK